MQGRFIVLEGPDGSGTTLHCEILAKRLQEAGKSVLLTNEPSSGLIGVFIRQSLASGSPLSPLALQTLFIADRADHVERVLKPALARGEIVICDRYASSTVAYGAALGLDAAWLAEMNAAFPQPDLQVFLLPPLEVCMERLGRRESRDALEGRELQSRVHDAYHTLAAADPSIRVLDTSGEKQVAAENIHNIVHSIL